MLEVEKAEEEIQSLEPDKVRYYIQQNHNKRYTVSPKDKELKWDKVIERKTIQKNTGNVIDKWCKGKEGEKYMKISEDPIDTVTIFTYKE